ncbi:hypothetical protein KI688_002908 [Linnemannia hyalina]|uniref:Uncharacterized protein n=1 Tax=Linnemannia hyalina TaxID=64524 RepID=A0A9P7XNP5_9FUNG|nr:hypothetical protein KI688_002908 [Linnemannia hyalina]
MHSKNVIAAARNSSALQIAVGEQQLKDALRELQGSQKQRSQEQLSAQEQEQEQEQGTSTGVLLGNELSSNPSDSDFQPSTSTSARTSLSTADFHYHNNLTGPGETSCRLRTKFKYVIGVLDVSERLMTARREMVKQQCTLKSTADLLSLNFIFTKVFLENNLPPETASRLSQQSVPNPKSDDVDLLLSCCLNVGSVDYQQGRAYIKERTAQQDSVAGDIISVYATSGILRDGTSKLAVNESTYIERSVKPLVTGTFAQLDFQEHWTIDPFPVPPDYEERLYPDFFAEKDGLPFAVLEVKSPDADRDDFDVDIRKIYRVLIHAFDHSFTLDRRCEVFSMDITYEAIYIPKALGTFEIPENKLQLPLLLHALGPLTAARRIYAGAKFQAPSWILRLTEHDRKQPTTTIISQRNGPYIQKLTLRFLDKTLLTSIAQFCPSVTFLCLRLDHRPSREQYPILNTFFGRMHTNLTSLYIHFDASPYPLSLLWSISNLTNLIRLDFHVFYSDYYDSKHHPPELYTSVLQCCPTLQNFIG